MLRVFVAAFVVLAALVLIKDGRFLTEAGLVGACSSVPAPDGINGAFESCIAGRLNGRPDLKRNSCVSIGFVGEAELWRCPAPLAGARAARS